jgi:hypothetical protein
MHGQLASILGPGDTLICVAVVAAWMVLMCLKTLAFEIQYAIRWHNLKIEVHVLRERQKKRLRDIAAKTAAARK